MKLKIKRAVLVFAVELMVYVAFVSLYLYLVVHYLGGWIAQVSLENRNLYAILSLALIVGQGLILESLTAALLKSIRSRLH